MMAARVDPPDAPLAIVVSQEEVTGASIARALRAQGYRTFAIDSACSDTDSLEGLRPAVIVLDIRGETASATRTLAALSDRPSSPPVVLFSAGDDATLVAARFGLLAVSQGAPERELLATIERSRRDQRRPTRR
jgi:DNA-binding response OmpR family regulator